MKQATKIYKRFVAFLVALVLLAVWFVPCCCAVGYVEASGVLNRAEWDLGSAYVVVAEAEGAGVDVSLLLSRLGSAGDFLSEAYAAFRVGDYGNANDLAIECSAAVEGIAGDVARLKADAEKAESDRLLLAGVGSGVGLVLLVVFGFLGWKFLKRWFFRQVLDMEPRVEGAS